jgi:nucleotide-binding universal stress UspA family protein
MAAPAAWALHPLSTFKFLANMKTILVPTDFSPPAQRALEYAVALACRTKSRIVLFHAFSQPINVELAMEIKDEIEKQEEREKIRLARLAQEVGLLQSVLQGQERHDLVMAGEEKGFGAFSDFPGALQGSLEIECQAHFGLVEDEIIKAAKKNKADLIVMGMRGGNELRELLIGSTTTGVMHRSPCPLLAVPDMARFQPIHTILFATDFKKLPEQPIIQTMLELKDLFQASLHLMHLYRPDQKRLEEELVVAEVKEAFPGHDYYLGSLERGKVLEDLPKQIQKIDPQLLVVVSPQPDLVPILLSNSLSRMLSFRSPVPLLALPGSAT